MSLSDNADKIAKRLISRGICEYEIVAGRSRTTSVEVKNAKSDSVKLSEPFGASVRLLSGGSLGFSFTSSFEPLDIDMMIDNALTAANGQTPDDCSLIPAFSEIEHSPLLTDSAITALSMSEQIEMATELENRCLEYDRRISFVRKASVTSTESSILILNSNGVNACFDSTSLSMSAAVLASQGSESESGWDFGFSHRRSGIDPSRIAEAASKKAVSKLGSRKIGTLKSPVILDSYAAAEMLELIAPSFLGENVFKGKSMLKGKLGKSIFSPSISISDNGLFEDGAGTSPFDGEGVSSRDSLVVDKGEHCKFLYDSFWGNKSGKESTGNSVRSSFKSLPHSGLRNLFVHPGSYSFKDLLEASETAILVTDMMGMHTANPVSGDFSVGISGFLVKQGELLHPVKELVLSGNILELFRNVEMCASDFRMYGSIGSPSLKVPEMDISGE